MLANLFTYNSITTAPFKTKPSVIKSQEQGEYNSIKICIEMPDKADNS